MPNSIKVDFVIRLLLASAIMAAAGWYLASLWDARMREQNLILILPVVVAMVPFYLWVLAFEIRRYRQALVDAGEAPAPAEQGGYEHLYFMGVSIVSVAAFYLFGAVPATIAAMVGGLFLLGVRNPLLLLLLPVGTVLVLWFVFVMGFGIRIPLFLFP